MNEGSNGQVNEARGDVVQANGHGRGDGAWNRGSLELKRGGFIAHYPPFETLERPNVEHIWDHSRFGLYVHLPYCRKRCTFCFYKVYTNRLAKPVDRYLQALHREIGGYGARPEFQGRTVHTVYFGGGTPTTLSVPELRALTTHLRRNFAIADDAEFTCEAEPGTLDARKVACLRDIGVTRLSLGVQSFDDDLLRKNGRSHASKQVFHAVELARANRFPVVNIDLMTGIVGETPETWARSLDTLIALAPEHVSIYRMEVYKNSLLYAAGYTGPGVGGIPTDEEELALWLQAVERLEAAGYTQITGHAFLKRPEHDHVQRTDVWSGCDLLGMGLSSYSYFNGCAFQNVSDWGAYVERAGAGMSAIDRALRLNSQQVMARDLILGLKARLRLEREPFRRRHGFDVLDLYAPQVDALVADGLLEVTPEALSFTRRGRAYVDIICSVFYLPEHAAYAFHRFGSKEELARAAVLQVDNAPRRAVPLAWSISRDAVLAR